MISLLGRGGNPNHWSGLAEMLSEGAKVSTIIATDSQGENRWFLVGGSLTECSGNLRAFSSLPVFNSAETHKDPPVPTTTSVCLVQCQMLEVIQKQT